MSPDIEEYLKEKYPKCFGQLPYFECGDGWKHIIESVAKVIEEEIEKCQDESIASMLSASQVKEKFGTLRFYVWGATDKVLGAILVAEIMSENICEVCGNQGDIRDLPWITTLCEEHFKEKNK